MDLFVSDLDNTLIYSYRREIGEAKRLVESKDGRALSFMTELTHRLLEQVRTCCCFVPSTTRSLEQYERISIFSDWTPQYALVSNGGNLLRNGEVDGEWYSESRRLCEEAESSLRDAERLLAEDPLVSFEVRRVDGLFIFSKSQDPQQTMMVLRERIDPQTAEVLNNGTKVYVMPGRLNKGEAVKRLRALTGAGKIYAAGDSEFDVPMLMAADEIWLPAELAAGRAARESGLLTHQGLHIASEEDIFSDCLLQAVVSLTERMDGQIPVGKQ